MPRFLSASWMTILSSMRGEVTACCCAGLILDRRGLQLPWRAWASLSNSRSSALVAWDAVVGEGCG